MPEDATDPRQVQVLMRLPGLITSICLSASTRSDNTLGTLRKPDNGLDVARVGCTVGSDPFLEGQSIPFARQHPPPPLPNPVDDPRRLEHGHPSPDGPRHHPGPLGQILGR